jgi:hypothetical protein
MPRIVTKLKNPLWIYLYNKLKIIENNPETFCRLQGDLYESILKEIRVETSEELSNRLGEILRTTSSKHLYFNSST